MVEEPKPIGELWALQNVIERLFASQTGARVTLDNGKSTTVLKGADAQDDCAVVGVSGQMDLLLGSDYVRGARFDLYSLGLLSNFDLGWYLSAANFSDVAAMGGQPVALLSVIRYPPDLDESEFVDVMNGIDEGCRSVGALNVGGDIGGAERLFLSAAALGIIEPGRALLRSTAKPGDVVCVTGPTGVAGAALRYFRQPQDQRGLSREAEQDLLRPWRRAEARVAAGRALSTSGVAHACVDTSDGLKGALEAISIRSHVGIVIDATALQIPTLIGAVAHLSRIDPLELVFGDSVDFELVFTVEERALNHLETHFSNLGQQFQRIGRVIPEEHLLLENSQGVLSPIPGQPWRQ